MNPTGQPHHMASQSEIQTKTQPSEGVKKALQAARDIQFRIKKNSKASERKLPPLDLNKNMAAPKGPMIPQSARASISSLMYMT